jgi:hypothetical protein
VPRSGLALEQEGKKTYPILRTAPPESVLGFRKRRTLEAFGVFAFTAKNYLCLNPIRSERQMRSSALNQEAAS